MRLSLFFAAYFSFSLFNILANKHNAAYKLTFRLIESTKINLVWILCFMQQVHLISETNDEKNLIL